MFHFESRKRGLCGGEEVHGLKPNQYWQFGVFHDCSFTDAFAAVAMFAFVGEFVVLPVPLGMSAAWADVLFLVV